MDIDGADKYGHLLDKLGKLVSCFGVLLGLAYIAGFSQTYFLFSELKAVWVLGLIDTQTLVRDGLPLATVCVLCTFLMFIWFPNSDSLREGMSSYLPFASVVIMVIVFIVGFLGGNLNGSPLLILGMKLVPLGASVALISWAAKLYFENAPVKTVCVSGIIGLVMAFGALPYFDASGQANSIKNGDTGLPVVITGDGKVSGVLAGVVSGKYIVVECFSSNIVVMDIESSLTVKPSLGRCS